MKYSFIGSLFTALFVTLFSSFQSMAATEMHGVDVWWGNSSG